MTDGDYALLKKAATREHNDTEGQPCARVAEIIQQSFSSRITQSLVGLCVSIEHVELFESLGFCPQVCALLQQRRALIERDELKKKWFSLIDQGDLEGVKAIIEDNQATKLEVLSEVRSITVWHVFMSCVEPTPAKFSVDSLSR